MAEFPDEVWDEILKRMGLKTFDGIENIRKILTFMGYTTLQTISKLGRSKELCSFQIEFSKLCTNIEFCEKYPELRKFQLGKGTIEVLKDVSRVASSPPSYNEIDLQAIQKQVFDRCNKVRFFFLSNLWNSMFSTSNYVRNFKISHQ